MNRGIVVMAVICCALFSRMAGASESSPDKYLELLRSDLRTQKVALVTQALDLSDAEGSKFWPIYREYDHKLSKITDARLLNIKAYAKNFTTMTNDKASELVNAALKINQNRFDLQKSYYSKIAKATSPVVAARFLQVESLVNNLVDLQIAAELPLVPKLVSVPAKQ